MLGLVDLAPEFELSDCIDAATVFFLHHGRQRRRLRFTVIEPPPSPLPPPYSLHREILSVSPLFALMFVHCIVAPVVVLLRPPPFAVAAVTQVHPSSNKWHGSMRCTALVT